MDTLNLRTCDYRLSLADKMNTLHIRVDNGRGHTIMRYHIAIPPQRYYYYQRLEWVKVVDTCIKRVETYHYEREWLPCRSYIGGGFKCGKLSDSFRKVVTQDFSNKLQSAFPMAEQLTADDIRSILDSFAL